MVPEHVRAVSRPVNTVVVDSKSKGAKRYLVRERAGYKTSKGHYSGPRNGKVIGYIIDGAYVPRQEEIKRVTQNSRSVMQYGAPAFVANKCKDIHQDLLLCFDPEDANRIMTISSLRVIDPGIACNRYLSKSQGSFLSVFYPCVGLTKNAVSQFIQHLGMSIEAQKNFYGYRLAHVAESQNIFIDGVLKQDTGNNDLSRDSAKTHLKGHKEISVIYAYSHDMQEVICSKAYQGNMLDSKAFRDFVKSNNVTKGVLVCDKGFPVSKIRDLLEQYPDLHYISPYRRNAKVIDELNLCSYEQCATLSSGVNVLCKKVSLPNGKYLFSIRDMSRASLEQNGMIHKGLKNNGTFDGEEYSKKLLKMGMIVFESDLDLSPLDILNHYDNRWWLETVFDLYKNTLDLDITRVQSRESVIGNEFINFVATLIACKLRNAMNEMDKLYGSDGSTFASRMSDLRDVYREVNAPANVFIDDGHWVLPASNASFTLMARLGLVDDPSGELTKLPKTRESKAQSSKNESQSTNVTDNQHEANKVYAVLEDNAHQTIVSDGIETAKDSGAKRGRGRPKGSLNKKTIEAMKQGLIVQDAPKRGRGRPKGSLNKKTIEAMKQGLIVQDAPKRGRGRPKGSLNKKTIEAIKNGLIDPNAPKRGRGRPSGSPNKISGYFKRNFIGPMPYGQKHPAIRKNTNPKTLWP